ncbi:MAG: aminoacyl-tRNA hydrolase [Bacteroidales bacterium]|nr:aminoacyl-tRNA hydrolase [Bacteroidales bacterium]
MKFLIVGLGNIGAEYQNTRHNIGFMVVDALAEKLNGTFTTERLGSVAKCRCKSHQVTILKPSTYMNLSGKAVRYWMDKEDIPIENILVVSDDLDLDFGTLRMKPKGSGGTHNGLNNIIEAINSSNFPRLRYGIGHHFSQGQQVDFVLGKWTEAERKELSERIPIAVQMCTGFMLAGIQTTMNQYNQKNAEQKIEK